MQQHTDLFTEIERRHDFRLPAAYIEFNRRGYLDPASPRYLDVFEGEWLAPASLATPDWSFHPGHRNDLLPFAINGRNDRWCWVTSRRSQFDEPPIVLCPREESEGHMDSPCLIGWVYGVALSYATGIWYSPTDTRRRVQRWAEVIRDFGQPDWADRLSEITTREPFEYASGPRQIKNRGFLNDSEFREAIAEAFGTDYVDMPFIWSSATI